MGKPVQGRAVTALREHVQALNRFKSWINGAHIHWDTSLVEIRGGSSWGVFAVTDIAEGSVLCTIPKRSILSVRNTGAADIIETERLGGGLGLILAIMYETGLKAESPWAGYIEALPTREYVPLFWGDSELQLLKGTQLAGQAEADRELTAEDFQSHILPLCKRYSGRLQRGSITLEGFRIAASLLASRAFGVDDHHGMALVPLADLFNHKCAVLSLSDAYTLEPACMAVSSEGETSDSEESSNHASEAEEAGNSDDDDSDNNKDSGDDSKSDSSREERAAKRPRITARSSLLGGSIAASQSLRLEIGICGVSKLVLGSGREEDVLEIVAASAIPRGQEVHNTYGEHGNMELLNKYGFTLPDNPFDAVPVDKELLLQEAETQLGKRRYNKRCSFLTEYSALLEEDQEPFEVLPDARLGPALLACLFLLSAPDPDFTNWKSLTEPLQQLARLLPADSDAGHTDKPLQIPTAEAAGGCSASTARPSKGELTAQQSDDPDLPSVSVAKAPTDVLPPLACSILANTLQLQLGRYQTPTLAEDEARLAQAKAAEASAAASSDQLRAQVAALTLVVGEKRIICSALELLQARKQ